MAFVILFGSIDLLGDANYEGGRSLVGQFLQLLGTSALVVGVAVGAGEFLGYALRFVSGSIADRTGKYWSVTLAGYGVQLLALPLLAFVGQWQIAVALLFAERIGKGIRNPSRDAMLSFATKQMGRGWGFGLHEAMDQTGALLGPLLVAAMLHWTGAYPAGFAVLLVPAILSLISLLTARRLYPRPRDLEPAAVELASAGIPRRFWLYLGGAGLIAAGYADFPLIAFHFTRADIVPAPWTPLLYALAMGVSALAALATGRLFDRAGLAVVAGAAIIAAGFAPLVFLGGRTAAILGMALWGLGMGAQDSIVRAAVAEMVPRDRRGSAFGLFDTGYGICWFLGSALMGVLYDRSVGMLVGFSVAAQVAAVAVIVLVARRQG